MGLTLTNGRDTMIALRHVYEKHEEETPVKVLVDAADVREIIQGR